MCAIRAVLVRNDLILIHLELLEYEKNIVKKIFYPPKLPPPVLGVP